MTLLTGDHDHDFWTGVAELVNTVAADITRTTGIDIDDLVSDTLLALAEHAARNPQWTTDRSDKTKYVTTVTGRRASRILHKQRRRSQLELAPAVAAQTPINQRDAWDDVLDTFGSVDVNREFVSEYIATRIRKMIRAAGGVAAILDRWEDDTITPDQTYALFNPWGTSGQPNTPPASADAWQAPSRRTQETVARTLRLAGPYADELWNLAVRESTRYDQRSHQHQRRGRRHVA